MGWVTEKVVDRIPLVQGRSRYIVDDGQGQPTFQCTTRRSSLDIVLLDPTRAGWTEGRKYNAYIWTVKSAEKSTHDIHVLDYLFFHQLPDRHGRVQDDQHVHV